MSSHASAEAARTGRDNNAPGPTDQPASQSLPIRRPAHETIPGLLPGRPHGRTRDHRDHREAPGTYTSTDLPAEPAAARQARQLTRDALTRWHLDRLTDDAAAIASELAANAQRAAVPPRGNLPAVIIAVHRRPRDIRITVWDNGPGRPRRTDPAPDAEHGRGLAIVSALSRHWGWWPTPASGGKVVYATLPAPGRDAP